MESARRQCKELLARGEGRHRSVAMTIIGAEVEAKGTRGLGAWDHVVGVGEVGLGLGF